MANYNRDFSGAEFDSLIEKYKELAEIRRAVETLTGEVEHCKILTALYHLTALNEKSSCPPHFCLNKTPSKQKVVKDTWQAQVKELKKVCRRAESFEHLLTEMSNLKTIEEVVEFIANRKKLGLEAKCDFLSNHRQFKPK